MTLGLLLLVLAAVTWPSRQGVSGLGLSRRAANGARRGARAGRPRTTQVADATDLLALCLRAGSPLVQALETVAEVSPSPVATDLTRVRAALGWGRTLREAWGFAGAGWSRTATATVVASECGAPVADVLHEAASALREQESRRLEAAAGRAGVLLVVPLGIFFLPAFVATSVVPVVLVMLGQHL